MKKLSGLVAALAVLLPGAAFAQSQGYFEGSYTRLSYIQGDVYIQRAQDQGYEKGELNLVVVQGDKIGTRSGRLELQLGRRNYLRLADDTVVEMAGLPVKDGDATKLHLLSGSLFLRVNALDREKAIELHTPDASFYILDQGLYRLDVRQNRETELGVLEGQAEAAGESGSTLVGAGQRIIAANGKFASEPQALLARNDAFADWNGSREAVYARRTTTSYLPAEYADYENELNDNGRWVYEEEYGNVWVPTVSDSDWRPYYWGRWVWYPIIGWTWVSYDSWGWCTHHYGRWGWRGGLGWYWIPHRDWYWGPAWVHWYWDNDYIGWCPLSYWGYPGVIVNNHFYGRHNRNDFRDYARTMTMVGRHQLQDRRLDRLALGSDRLLARGGRIDLRGAQPDVRAVRTDGRLAGEASRALSGSQLRSVNRAFDGRGLRIGSEDIRSSASRRAVNGGTAVPGGSVRDRSDAGASISSRRIGGGLSSGGSARSEGSGSNSSRGISGDTRFSAGSSDRAIRVYPRTRDSGSGISVSGRSSSTSSRSISSRSRLIDSDTPPSLGDGTSIRRYDSGSASSRDFAGSSRVRDSDSSGSPGSRGLSSSSRSNNDGSWTNERRSIREYAGRSDPSESRSSSGSRGLSVGGRESSSESGAAIRRDDSSRGSSSSSGGGIRVTKSRDSDSSARNYSSSLRSAPSSFREYSSSPRIGGSSSRALSPGSSSTGYFSSSRVNGSSGSSSPPRSYSSSSRITSSPSFGSSSRSYSAPSRSYSSPSRSYSSSSSRITSSPSFGSSSRSYSAPSRSYSSPSRSYSSSSSSRSTSSPSFGSSSRSYSAPSRSYSSSSRSSGSSSFSRSSSSSSRSSSSSSRSSSSGRSSGGGGRRR